jgi:hypothetical protein
MRDAKPKRLVMAALAQFLLSIIVAFTTGTVWLINGSMLRSSPPAGVRQFDAYLTVGFIASVILVIVAAFHLENTRRSVRSFMNDHPPV